MTSRNQKEESTNYGPRRPCNLLIPRSPRELSARPPGERVPAMDHQARGQSPAGQQSRCGLRIDRVRLPADEGAHLGSGRGASDLEEQVCACWGSALSLLGRAPRGPTAVRHLHCQSVSAERCSGWPRPTAPRPLTVAARSPIVFADSRIPQQLAMALQKVIVRHPGDVVTNHPVQVFVL